MGIFIVIAVIGILAFIFLYKNSAAPQQSGLVFKCPFCKKQYSTQFDTDDLEIFNSNGECPLCSSPCEGCGKEFALVFHSRTQSVKAIDPTTAKTTFGQGWNDGAEWESLHLYDHMEGDGDRGEEYPHDNDRDAWELDFRGESIDPITINTTIQFDYRDGNGNATKRTVNVREYDKVYGGAIIGLCQLRSATRTFRTDRMANCTNPETGEPIADVNEHLLAIYNSSPQASLDKIPLDVASILLYVSKADGQYRQPEKVIVREAIRQQANDDHITDEMVDEVMKITVPSKTSFQRAVGRVVRGESECNIDLVTTAQAIIDTGKTTTPTEQEIIDYLKKKLGNKALSTEAGVTSVL